MTNQIQHIGYSLVMSQETSTGLIIMAVIGIIALALNKIIPRL